MKKIILALSLFLISLSSFSIIKPDTLLFVDGRKVPIIDYNIDIGIFDYDNGYIYYKGLDGVKYSEPTNLFVKVIRYRKPLIQNTLVQNTLPIDQQVKNLNNNINSFYKEQRLSQYYLGAGIACSVIGLLVKPSDSNNYNVKNGFYIVGGLLSTVSFIVYLDSFKFLK